MDLHTEAMRSATCVATRVATSGELHLQSGEQENISSKTPDTVIGKKG